MKKLTLVALLFVFTAPVVIAVLLNSQWLDWRPGSTRNHGELIEPPLRLPDFELAAADGTTASRERLSGRWQLLHYRSGECVEACMEALYWLRQVRRAQDRHQPEVGLVFVTESALDAATIGEIRALADDYTVLHAGPGRRLAEALPDHRGQAISYIVDPDGHIILRYPQDADFNGMRRDLSRLLTWTQTAPE